MDLKNILNPYELMGIDAHTPSLKKLKKAYYSLALLCHPDKGGSEEDMKMVLYAYRYIKEQFENCTNLKSYDERLMEFEAFCSKQKVGLPNINKIWDKSDKGKEVKDFNKKFEKQRSVNPFDGGYGDNMSKSKYAEGKLTYDKNNLDKKIKHKFKNIASKNELVEYREPQSYQQGYGDYERLDIKNIKNFSHQGMADYSRAFKILGEKNINKYKIKERSYKQLVNERKLLSQKEII